MLKMPITKQTLITAWLLSYRRTYAECRGSSLPINNIYVSDWKFLMVIAILFWKIRYLVLRTVSFVATIIMRFAKIWDITTTSYKSEHTDGSFVRAFTYPRWWYFLPFMNLIDACIYVKKACERFSSFSEPSVIRTISQRLKLSTLSKMDQNDIEPNSADWEIFYTTWQWNAYVNVPTSAI